MQDTRIYREIDAFHQTNFSGREMDFLERKKAVFRMDNGKPVYRIHLEHSVVEVRKTNDMGIYECVVADKKGCAISYASGDRMSRAVKKGISRYLEQVMNDDVKQELQTLMEELGHECAAN